MNKFILESIVRPNILRLNPYSSARDEFDGTGEIFIDANESPFETGRNRYPDPYQNALKQKVSSIKGIPPESIFLGNGSDEAIDLIMRIFCVPGEDNIIVTDPTYGMYQVSAAIHDLEVLKVPLSPQFGLDASKILEAANVNSKVVFICSPNNPTGNTLATEQIKSVLDKFSGVVVIDEAYIDFTRSASWSSKLSEYPNLIVLQTFSKAWGLAGLRIGMAFAQADIIAYFNKVKPPYNINVLTQQETIKVLNNKKQVDDNVKQVLVQKTNLIKNLSQLPIVQKVFPSDSNFLLVRFQNATKVFDYLIDNGIIVRDRSKALHCENCLRITIGELSENNRLIELLKKFKDLTT